MLQGFVQIRVYGDLCKLDTTVVLLTTYRQFQDFEVVEMIIRM